MALDDFEPATPPSSWTSELEFTSGVFQLSPAAIEYFSTSIPLAALASTFKLVEDISGSENWGYNAIFQRDIDTDRVKEELLDGYLRKETKFKFFNPLTIALLPFDGKSHAIRDKYRDPTEDYDDGNYRVRRIDGIEIRNLRAATVGKIRWDINRINAVAIDGQHRLSALIEFAKNPTPGVDPAACMIPVLLMLLSPNESGILPQIREIFIDINKTAKPVSKSRQILLDDRDPFAIMARDIIKDQYSEDEGIPFEVVDWKRRQSLRPEDEQLTTILVLYQCVMYLFDNSTRRIEADLQINAELRRQNLTEVHFSTGSCIEHRAQERVLLERFRQRHKRFLVTLFRTFTPYANVLHVLESALSQPNGKCLREYLFKPESKRPEARSRFLNDGINVKAVVDDALDRLVAAKSRTNVLVPSVGQRGVFSWFRKVFTLYSSVLDESSYEAIASAYAEDLNRLARRGFFEREFQVGGFPIWEGVCLRNGAIQWTKAAARRIGALILLCVSAMRLGVDDNIEDSREGRRLRLSAPLKYLIGAYEPLIDLGLGSDEVDDGVGDEEGEWDTDDQEGDEFDEEEPTDLRIAARQQVYDILCWIRNEQ